MALKCKGQVVAHTEYSQLKAMKEGVYEIAGCQVG